MPGKTAASSHPDQLHWNARYADPAFRPPSAQETLLERFRDLLTGGVALDVACGRGAVLRHLVTHGYRVVGVDISDLGLADCRTVSHGAPLPIYLVQADLDQFAIPPAAFDCVTVFFYYNPALAWPITAGLRPGGLLIAATYNQRRLEQHPGHNPGYLLRQGEMARMYPGLNTLEVCDGMPGHPEISYLVARKPLPPDE